MLLKLISLYYLTFLSRVLERGSNQSSLATRLCVLSSGSELRLRLAVIACPPTFMWVDLVRGSQITSPFLLIVFRNPPGSSQDLRFKQKVGFGF